MSNGTNTPYGWLPKDLPPLDPRIRVLLVSVRAGLRTVLDALELILRERTN